MEDIEFRGKTLNEDEWVYGNYEWYHKPRKHIISNPYTRVTKGIRPQTLGMFIGTYDKNKKKIYEGDIMEFDFPQIGKQKAVVEWGSYYAHFHLKPLDDFMYANFEEGVVIGNIHDNPEMLEVTPK